MNANKSGNIKDGSKALCDYMICYLFYPGQGHDLSGNMVHKQEHHG